MVCKRWLLLKFQKNNKNNKLQSWTWMLAVEKGGQYGNRAAAPFFPFLFPQCEGENGHFLLHRDICIEIACLCKSPHSFSKNQSRKGAISTIFSHCHNFKQYTQFSHVALFQINEMAKCLAFGFKKSYILSNWKCWNWYLMSLQSCLAVVRYSGTFYASIYFKWTVVLKIT